MKKIFISIATILFCTSGFAVIDMPAKTSTMPEKADTAVQYVTVDKPFVMVSSQKNSFTIKLKSNATTGYTWFLSSYDKSLVQPVSHQYQHATSQLVGAPGYELWTFKLKPEAFHVPHVTMINFVYSRPWENGDQGETVQFKISTTQEKGN